MFRVVPNRRVARWLFAATLLCLMASIAHAQREVDRIDVFERRDEARQVRQGKGRSQHPEGGANHWIGRNRSASFKLPRR